MLGKGLSYVGVAFVLVVGVLRCCVCHFAVEFVEVCVEEYGGISVSADEVL